MPEKDIQKTVLSLVKAEADTLKGKEAPAVEKPVDYTFLQECFRANSLGDGTYFAHLHHGKFVYAKKLQQWLVFTGQHWEVDHMERIYHGIEEVALAYLDYSYQMQKMVTEEKAKGPDASLQKISRLQKEEEAYYKRGNQLRADNRPESCLRYAHRIKQSPLAITGDELDSDPWLLACSNGVIDLRTGELRQGKPEDYLVNAIETAWEGIDAEAPTWKAFLEDIFAVPKDLAEQCEEYPALKPYMDNPEQYTQDLISALLRALGYSITGLSCHHFFMVFMGEGRNGKSTLIEMMLDIFQPLAGVIPSEMLLDQGRSRSSSGPSPDLMLLKGLRLSIASETDENRKFSPGAVKWLSGGDTITARELNTMFVKFKPTHTLALLTNHLPHAPAEDFPFWDRLKLFPFNWKYLDHPDPEKNHKKKDPDLLDKLKKEKAGILASIVRGCLEYQVQGLNWPLVVQVATEKYRKQEDIIGQFIEDCCEKDENPATRTKFPEAYQAFKNWYLGNKGTKKTLIQKKKFSDLFSKRFQRKKVGDIYFYGVIVTDPGEEGVDKSDLWPDE